MQGKRNKTIISRITENQKFWSAPWLSCIINHSSYRDTVYVFFEFHSQYAAE